MYRNHPAYLAWVLEALVDGDVVNEIVVPDRVKAAARVALARMLSLPGQPAPAVEVTA
jgi:quinolinate synthase